MSLLTFFPHKAVFSSDFSIPLEYHYPPSHLKLGDLDLSCIILFPKMNNDDVDDKNS